MTALLGEFPLLTLFLVVALGAAVGAIKLGPVRLGAAGALFVGLVISAWQPQLSGDLALIQQLGLLLFVYTVGIASGANLKAGLKENSKLLIWGCLAAVLGAVVAGLSGNWFGLDDGLVTGLYTGSLTAGPALDAAEQLVGDGTPAVGYSLGYPVGVLVGIVFVTVVSVRHWPGSKDTPSLAGRGLHAVTVQLANPVNPRDVRAWVKQQIRFSYVRRDQVTRVFVPGEELMGGDQVVIVGQPGIVEEVAGNLGTIVTDHLADDRSIVDFERLTVSNPDIAGLQVSQLNLSARYGALVTRVRRGDFDLLARDDLTLQPGDQVAVVVPRQEMEAVRSYFGDSQRKVAEVDALALGIGLVLGLLLGLVALPLPGGVMFQLGPAAGPLVMGMVLGAIRRTGPLVWTLPESANLTIRQLGLLFFLAALGLGAGPSVKSLLVSDQGWQAALVALVVAVVALSVMVLGAYLSGLSAPRGAGGVAGFLGQPAVLQAANARVVDERIESAYGVLFAAMIVAKIFLVPLVWVM